MERFFRNPEGQATQFSNENGGKRVLLVEDNQNQRRMCCLAFKFKYPKHEVKSVGTAKEALELAKEFRPDVILVDFGLPDMSGCELCECLREERSLGHARIISLSGRGEPSDYQKSEEAGFARHMVKPPDLDELERWFYE